MNNLPPSSSQGTYCRTPVIVDKGAARIRTLSPPATDYSGDILPKKPDHYFRTLPADQLITCRSDDMDNGTAIKNLAAGSDVFVVVSHHPLNSGKILSQPSLIPLTVEKSEVLGQAFVVRRNFHISIVS